MSNNRFPVHFRRVWLVFALSLACVLVIIGLMAPIEQNLKKMSPYGVMDLEFMWIPEKADAIMQSWGSDLINQELYATYLDFLFIPCYSLMFASLELLVFRKTDSISIISTPQRTHKKEISTHTMFLMMPFLAALFDIMENVGNIHVLSNSDSFMPAVPLLVSVAASIKFFFLGLVTIGILIQFSAHLLRSWKSTRS